MFLSIYEKREDLKVTKNQGWSAKHLTIIISFEGSISIWCNELFSLSGSGNKTKRGVEFRRSTYNVLNLTASGETD